MRNRYPKYLDTETYKRVLSVAKSYYSNKKKIKEIEDDIINSSPSHQEPVSSSLISNATQNKAESICRYTSRLKSDVSAVESALDQFEKPEQLFIVQNILCGMRMIDCDVFMSERSGQRIRHDFLLSLAVELGETF